MDSPGRAEVLARRLHVDGKAERDDDGPWRERFVAQDAPGISAATSDVTRTGELLANPITMYRYQ